MKKKKKKKKSSSSPNKPTGNLNACIFLPVLNLLKFEKRRENEEEGKG